jgi:molybdenum cofactor cytidylyltransferase
MSRSPAFCGVVLAAGASSRMGRDKALLPWPPPSSAPSAGAGTFLSAQIELLSSSTDMVLIVAGRNAALLRPIAYAMGAYVVENPDPDRGQFSSLRVGLQEVLNRGRDAAVVALVDRPPASAETLKKLRNVFMASEAKENWAVVPEYEGRHGHPIIVGREMMTAFLEAPDSSTAREVEHKAQQHVVYVPVKDPNIALNVDTPQDYERLQHHLQDSPQQG